MRTLLSPPSSSRAILVIDEALMCYCLSQTLQNVIKRPFRSKYLKRENANPGGPSLSHSCLTRSRQVGIKILMKIFYLHEGDFLDSL